MVKYPFMTKEYMGKVITYFYFYSVISLLMSILRGIWAVPQDALCMSNFKSSLDILGFALTMISLSLTHLLVLVSVIVFSTLIYNNFKTSAHMSGRAWSNNDQAITVHLEIQCVCVACVTIFIIGEAVLKILSIAISVNEMQWIGFILLQLIASFNP